MKYHREMIQIILFHSFPSNKLVHHVCQYSIIYLWFTELSERAKDAKISRRINCDIKDNTIDSSEFYNK